MTAAKPSIVLAFDFGLRNIGVATGQMITRTATELVTLRARDGVPDWSQIAALIDEWRPDLLLVGLPLNMDDTNSAMAARAERFAKQLKRRFERNVALVDERLTSYEARGLSRDIDAQHAIAARLIAETFLNDTSR